MCMVRLHAGKYCHSVLQYAALCCIHAYFRKHERVCCVHIWTRSVWHVHSGRSFVASKWIVKKGTHIQYSIFVVTLLDSAAAWQTARQSVDTINVCRWLQCVAVCRTCVWVDSFTYMCRMRVFAKMCLEDMAQRCREHSHKRSLRVVICVCVYVERACTRIPVTGRTATHGNTMQLTVTHCDVTHECVWVQEIRCRGCRKHSRRRSHRLVMYVCVCVYVDESYTLLRRTPLWHMTRECVCACERRKYGAGVLQTHLQAPSPSSRHTAIHCNTLQHAAIDCNTLQHNTATHCNTAANAVTE